MLFIQTRFIIVREIAKIDTTNLNMFITRLMEYNNFKNKEYLNLVIFDVAHDQRGLFEKIKPNLLSKMKFRKILNFPAKFIYKEILYNFVTNEKNIFIPNTNNIKKIIDFINNHQISVHSFKNYFKFLVIDYFLLNKWDEAQSKFLVFDMQIPNDNIKGRLNEYLDIINKSRYTIYK